MFVKAQDLAGVGFRWSVGFRSAKASAFAEQKPTLIHVSTLTVTLRRLLCVGLFQQFLHRPVKVFVHQCDRALIAAAGGNRCQSVARTGD